MNFAVALAALLGGQQVRFDTSQPVYVAGTRLDSNQTIFLERELEHIQAKVLEAPKPKLNGMMHFAVSTEAGPGVEAITYRQETDFGRWAHVGAAGGGDAPRVGVAKGEHTSKVSKFFSSYGWTEFDLLSAARTGTPLSAKLGQACLRAHDSKLNNVMWRGDSEAGIDGLVNNTSIPKKKAAKTWANSTSDEIRSEILGAIRDVIADSKDVEAPDRCLLPISQYLLLIERKQGTADNTNSLLDELRLKARAMSNRADFDFYGCQELTGAGPDSSDIMYIGQKDPMVAEYQLPMAFRQTPVQRAGLEYLVYCIAQFGELIVYRPKAFRAVYGI
jgi:hypothetical protein